MHILTKGHLQAIQAEEEEKLEMKRQKEDADEEPAKRGAGASCPVEAQSYYKETKSIMKYEQG